LGSSPPGSRRATVLETFGLPSRNYRETKGWQESVIEHSTFRRVAMLLFLKPLIGFTATTSVLGGVDRLG
jgi:hypothetical protein